MTHPSSSSSCALAPAPTRRAYDKSARPDSMHKCNERLRMRAGYSRFTWVPPSHGCDKVCLRVALTFVGRLQRRDCDYERSWGPKVRAGRMLRVARLSSLTASPITCFPFEGYSC